MTVGPLPGTVPPAQLVARAFTDLGDAVPTPGEVRRAYITLHGRLRTAYLSAYQEVARKGRKNSYVETFRVDRRQGKVLTEAPQVVAAAKQVPAIVAGLDAAMRRATLIAASLQSLPAPASLLFEGDLAIASAQSLLARSAGPFEQAFRQYAAAAGPRLLAMSRARWLPGVFESPVLQHQVTLAHLVVANFAFLATYAALPAGALYESVDGNTGARAAGTKLGARLVGANGQEARDADLLGFVSTAGSLEDYSVMLWSNLGVTRSTAGPALNPLIELSDQLVAAEIGETSRRVAGLQGDALASWGSGTEQGKPAGPRHLPVTTGSSAKRFVPTWPHIVERPPIYALNRGSQVDPRVIMHAEPGAQLGLLVATTLYRRTAPFLTPKGDPVQNPATVLVTAGSLEFGGRHRPHDTHRSGVEADLDQTDLRNLDNSGLPQMITSAGVPLPLGQDQEPGEFLLDEKHPRKTFHPVWAKQLLEAIAAEEITAGPPFDTFRTPAFDRYATPEPADPQGRPQDRPRDDKPRVVAQARALCLSIHLSGASRLLFGDPWVFIDSFHRLRAARDVFETRAAGTLASIRPIAWPTPATAILEPYAHHNHWHAEWQLRLDRSVPRPPELTQTAAGPDVIAWAPIWHAMGIELPALQGVLADVGQQNPASAPQCRQLAKLLNWRWRTLPQLPDLFTLVYDGDEPGDRALLSDTAHTGTGPP